MMRIVPTQTMEKDGRENLSSSFKITISMNQPVNCSIENCMIMMINSVDRIFCYRLHNLLRLQKLISIFRRNYYLICFIRVIFYWLDFEIKT